MTNLTGRICGLISSLRHAGTFLLNDPTTPNLTEIIPAPAKGPLKFSVEGMSERPENSSEVRSANCHSVIGNCLNNMQPHCKTPVKNWSWVPELKVYPSAGRDMNAYYDRRSLKFFYYPYAGKNVYFSDSADIVAHELGHAFLDAMRPDFWSVQSLEIWSFHEGFSDIVAMFNLMNYDKAIRLALEETDGRMDGSNVISKLAEEVGSMIRGVTKDPSYLPDALRDPSLEHFKYIDPKNLPKEAPNNVLAAECHSFGRVFSGAWYRMFVEIFRMHAESSDSISAFKSARDAAFSILMHSVPVSPRTDKYYSAVTKAMFAVGKSRNDRYGEIIRSVFSDWNMFHEDGLRPQSCGDLRARIVSNLSREDRVLKTGESTLISLKKRKFFDVKDLPIASAMSLGSSVKIEVPYDSYYEFDAAGNLKMQKTPDENEVKESVATCLISISDQIGPGKMWNVESGELKRNYIK
jgi:hypothetical protein